MEIVETVKMEPNLLGILMDEHLMAIQRDTQVALDRFEKSGLQFDGEFLNSFLKQSYDCMKETCIKYSIEAKMEATCDSQDTPDKTASATGAENSEIPFLKTDKVSESMKKGSLSLKRKASDALHDDNELLKKQKTMDTIVDRDKNDKASKTAGQHLRHTIIFCAHCLDEWNPSKSFNGTINDVYEHWLSEHLNESLCKPFQFYPITLVSCFHCQEAGTYYDLVNHHKQRHPGKQFTIIDRGDPKKCGICYFKNGDMVEHFLVKHKSVTKLKYLNPIIYSDKQINELLAIDFHRNFYGDRNKPTHLICGFCQKKINCDTFLHHFNEHTYSFKCSHCTYHSVSLVELVSHEKSAHLHDSLTYHCNAFTKWIRKKFLNTILVFGNGLLLKHFNVARTKFDKSKQFDEFINAFLDKTRDEVGKNLESAGPTNDTSDEALKPTQVFIEIN